MVKGNRQKEPIDKELVLGFRVNDPAALLPTASDDKHVLLTSGVRGLTDVHVSMTSPTRVSDLTGGGEISVMMDGGPVSATVGRADHFRIVSTCCADTARQTE